MAEWYKLDADAVVGKLGSDLKEGLSATEAKARLEEYGLNELVERGSKSPLLILWDQLREVMVIILFVAAAVSAALGEYNDVIVIMTIVVLNAVLFDDWAASKLAIQIGGVELDTFDPDDRLLPFRQLFSGDPEAWYGHYAPTGEAVDLQDLDGWRLWFRIEPAG